MTKVLVTEGNLQDIASAIRSKNGSNDSYRPGDMATAIRAIPTRGTQVSKAITRNGTYDPSDDHADGYSGVTVNVPNSYAAGDEGKVVSAGALVAQTGLSVTRNGTYDTTENNEVVVNVQGGGGPDRGFMCYHFLGDSYNPCKLKENCKWLYNFTSSSAYMRPAQNDGSLLKPDWRQPFEIKVTFRITNTYSNSMVLFGMEQGFFYGPSIEVQTSNNRLWAGVSTSGSRWNYDIYIGAQDGATLPLNTVVWVKYEWDGTDITVTYHDGTDTFTKTVTPSAPPYYSSSYNLEFGGINKSSGHYARYIEFDLENTYIKQNGVMIWGCSA